MIRSAQNKLVKELMSLNIKKWRDKLGLFIVEGERFVDEIPDNWKINRYVVSESFAAVKDTSKYSNRAEMIVMADNIFKLLSDTVTPQGVLAVCTQKNFGLNAFNKNCPFLLIGERISDPGNLGTLIRTADAAGCDAIILSQGSADLYNPKVIRATAASIFHLPIITNVNLKQVLPKLAEQSICIIAAHLNGKTLPYKLNLTQGCAILIGNEANGLSAEIAALATNLVKIPMPGKAESLNASVASGVLLYEVVRQRLNLEGKL